MCLGKVVCGRGNFLCLLLTLSKVKGTASFKATSFLVPLLRILLPRLTTLSTCPLDFITSKFFLIANASLASSLAIFSEMGSAGKSTSTASSDSKIASFTRAFVKRKRRVVFAVL